MARESQGAAVEPGIPGAGRRARALGGAPSAPEPAPQLQERFLRYLPRARRARHVLSIRTAVRSASLRRRRRTGYALICQARATTDLVIEIREIRHVTDVEIRELPARVERMERLAPDVMGLWLRLPAIEPFTWQCGQYVDVMLSGDRRRSFSLANPPRDAALLELHVRRARGGEFSERVFGDMKPGSLLRIEGPLGQFIYRPGDRPLLLIGGGTGYAPLKAMIREALDSKAGANSISSGAHARRSTCTTTPGFARSRRSIRNFATRRCSGGFVHDGRC